MEKFGENTLDIIDETPEELIKVPGIGKVRAERIKTSWKDQKEIKNIMLFLQSNEVSTSHATKIYKTYGSESISIVKKIHTAWQMISGALDLKQPIPLRRKWALTRQNLSVCAVVFFIP